MVITSVSHAWTKNQSVVHVLRKVAQSLDFRQVETLACRLAEYTLTARQVIKISSVKFVRIELTSGEPKMEGNESFCEISCNAVGTKVMQQSSLQQSYYLYLERSKNVDE